MCRHYARSGLLVVLVVITLSAAVEAWASVPVLVGPGFALHPVVIGPAALSALHGGDERPEWALLGALLSLSSRTAVEHCVRALLRLEPVHEDRARQYLEAVLVSLEPAGLDVLEELMSLTTQQPRSEFFRTWQERLLDLGRQEGRQAGLQAGREAGREEGREEGRRQGALIGARNALRSLLRTRFGDLPAALNERIDAAELADVEAALPRVLTAAEASEVLPAPR